MKEKMGTSNLWYYVGAPLVILAGSLISARMLEDSSIVN
jgi:hypothetical protein